MCPAVATAPLGGVSGCCGVSFVVGIVIGLVRGSLSFATRAATWVLM